MRASASAWESQVTDVPALFSKGRAVQLLEVLEVRLQKSENGLHSSRCTCLKNKFSVHTLGELLVNTSILPCLAGGIG